MDLNYCEVKSSSGLLIQGVIVLRGISPGGCSPDTLRGCRFQAPEPRAKVKDRPDIAAFRHE